jgi:hypothetical protein
MRKWRAESVLDLYNLVLATVLFISPWVFARASETAVVDLRISAVAIAILSIAAIVAFSYWEEWANLLLGLWLVVSPWLLGFAHTSAMHFAIGIGSAIAFMTLLDLWLRFEAAEQDATQSGKAQQS